MNKEDFEGKVKGCISKEFSECNIEKRFMDSRRVTKTFINYICNWVEYEYKSKHADGFSYELKDRTAILVADKGIEKRIQKQLLKRLGINSKVRYEVILPKYAPPHGEHGELRIRLIKNEFIPELCFPFNRRY